MSTTITVPRNDMPGILSNLGLNSTIELNAWFVTRYPALDPTKMQYVKKDQVCTIVLPMTLTLEDKDALVQELTDQKPNLKWK